MFGRHLAKDHNQMHGTTGTPLMLIDLPSVAAIFDMYTLRPMSELHGVQAGGRTENDALRSCAAIKRPQLASFHRVAVGQTQSAGICNYLVALCRTDNSYSPPSYARLGLPDEIPA